MKPARCLVLALSPDQGPGAGRVSHVVLPVVDVHPVRPALVTHPLQARGRLAGPRCGRRSRPGWGWTLAVVQLVPALRPASLNVRESPGHKAV